METLMELIAEIFIRSWFGSAIFISEPGFGMVVVVVPSRTKSDIQANPLWVGRFQ